jgi:hypothetical protein
MKPIKIKIAGAKRNSLSLVAATEWNEKHALT